MNTRLMTIGIGALVLGAGSTTALAQRGAERDATPQRQIAELLSQLSEEDRAQLIERLNRAGERQRGAEAREGRRAQPGADIDRQQRDRESFMRRPAERGGFPGGPEAMNERRGERPQPSARRGQGERAGEGIRSGLRERLENATPEQRRAMIERLRNAGPEDRRAFAERLRGGNQPEARRAPSGQQRDGARRPQASRAPQADNLRERIRNASPEARQALRERLSNMDPERRRAFIQRLRQGADQGARGQRPGARGQAQRPGARGQAQRGTQRMQRGQRGMAPQRGNIQRGQRGNMQRGQRGMAPQRGNAQRGQREGFQRNQRPQTPRGPRGPQGFNFDADSFGPGPFGPGQPGPDGAGFRSFDGQPPATPASHGAGRRGPAV